MIQNTITSIILMYKLLDNYFPHPYSMLWSIW